MFPWSDKFSVKNSTLDMHHRRLFDYINALEKAIAQGNETEVASIIFPELAAYASYHFGEEEALFDLKGYPRAGEHKEAHLQFRLRLAEFKKPVHSGDRGAVMALFQFLRSWLRTHILTEDQRYVPYLGDPSPK